MESGYTFLIESPQCPFTAQIAESSQFRARGGTETPHFSDVEEEAKEFKELA